MPRTPFKCCPNSPYHLSARSHNKSFFQTPMDETWSIMSDFLNLISYGYNVKVHSFVLMSNHFHLLATFPEANLSQAMQYFMRESSRHISTSAGHINQVYGNRVYRSRIDQYYHYINIYKYIYRNPVEAHLCKNVIDYKYSTLRGLIGLDRLTLRIEEDLILFNGRIEHLESELAWLNKAPEKSYYLDMKNGLHRRVFKLRKVNHKDHLLNSSFY